MDAARGALRDRPGYRSGSGDWQRDHAEAGITPSSIPSAAGVSWPTERDHRNRPFWLAGIAAVAPDTSVVLLPGHRRDVPTSISADGTGRPSMAACCVDSDHVTGNAATLCLTAEPRSRRPTDLCWVVVRGGFVEASGPGGPVPRPAASFIVTAVTNEPNQRWVSDAMTNRRFRYGVA